jgi:hypothetical protein
VSGRTPFRADTVAHELEDEGQVVVYDAEHNQLLVLNEIGAAVWFLVDGCRTVTQITEQVAGAFQANVADVGRDVEAFLGALEARGLIEYR